MIREFLTRSSIRKLELQPGDIVLIRLRGQHPPEVLDVQRRFFAEKLPEGVTAILMDDSVTIEVLRPAEAS